MSDLPDRLRASATPTDLYAPRPPARLQRAVTQAVHTEHGRAIVAAARVRAVHYVTTQAVQAVDDLTTFEALALQRNPLVEGRIKAINDVATAALAQIVAETGRS